MNLVNEGVLPPDEMDDRDERREEQERARSRETVADVVADLRKCAQRWKKLCEGIKDGNLREALKPQTEIYSILADRLEAAWKRELDRAVEHATRHAEAVARDNCRDCVHNPSGKNYEGGNAAAMRGALVFLRDQELWMLEGNVRHCIGLTVFGLEQTCKIMRGVIEDALSAPPCNCDVGTAEEQSDRFAHLCDSHSGCSQCPVKSLWNFANGHKPSCGVLWAQMPYKAEEGTTDAT